MHRRGLPSGGRRSHAGRAQRGSIGSGRRCAVCRGGCSRRAGRRSGRGTGQRARPKDCGPNSAASTSWSTMPVCRVRDPIAGVDHAEWQRVIGANLTGAYLCCLAAAPHMEKQKERSHHQYIFHKRPDGRGRRRRPLRQFEGRDDRDDKDALARPGCRATSRSTP